MYPDVYSFISYVKATHEAAYAIAVDIHFEG